jgi:hypothetical protein
VARARGAFDGGTSERIPRALLLANDCSVETYIYDLVPSGMCPTQRPEKLSIKPASASAFGEQAKPKSVPWMARSQALTTKNTPSLSFQFPPRDRRLEIAYGIHSNVLNQSQALPVDVVSASPMAIAQSTG